MSTSHGRVTSAARAFPSDVPAVTLTSTGDLAAPGGDVTGIRTDTISTIAPMPRLAATPEQWRAGVLHLEEAGFDYVAISEHFSGGWAMDALTAMSFALAATTRLHVMSLVLDNDMHHPGILAKAIATADVLSGGRALLGLGAGWLADDYTALGLSFDPPARRIARLREALGIVRRFFLDESVDADGPTYHLAGLEALPRPTSPGGPPILVGGGGRGILTLAGQLADVVGIHVTLGVDGFSPRAAAELSGARVAAKVAVVREAAVAAGRPMPAFQMTPAVVVVAGRPATRPRPGFTDYVAEHADLFADSPAVLVGSAQQVADDIRRWNAELGFAYWHLGADTAVAAQVVDRLTA